MLMARFRFGAGHGSNVTGAQRELLKYYASITSNRWLMLKIFGVLIIFVSSNLDKIPRDKMLIASFLNRSLMSLLGMTYGLSSSTTHFTKLEPTVSTVPCIHSRLMKRQPATARRAYHIIMIRILYRLDPGLVVLKRLRLKYHVNFI
jgi:hypothetical protein